MNCLRFSMGDGLYGLNTEEVVEIVPRIGLTPIVGAPDYVPGYFTYRGRVVPVVDMSRLTTGTAAEALLSSRIAVVRYGNARLLGLLLENATHMQDTAEMGAEGEQDSGIRTEARYMGGIIVGKGHQLQLVKVRELLPEDVRNRVFMD